jgi:phenylpropionate dioxygenase-like ring-hydroxylating dioxygenase large terminal subunit
MSERFPFSIPNGWFQIAYSDELEPGGVLPLHYFGQDLVLFRAEGGEVALLDAFCPHLGAHLGHGGVVDGDRIRCPFHAWEFDTRGACRNVPYARKVPPKAKVAPWNCAERNRIIWAWHHVEGVAPTWEIPDVPEVSSDDWTALERHRWTVRTHNQEIGENAVDRAHFRYVHGTTNVPESELELDGHIRRAVQHVHMSTPRGEVKGQIKVEAHGMGCTITRFTGICETVLLLSHTPIDGGSVDSRFSFTQRKADQKTGVAAGVIKEVVRQMNQDIPIWEHKKYLPKPMLCDGDGPIPEYRKWASQFYH